MKKMSRQSLVFKVLLTSTFLGLGINTVIAQNQMVEGSLAEDEFRRLPSWAGKNWPASKILQINDSLVNAPVGKIVVDKHGEEECRDLICFRNPLAAPFPGRSVYISLWGSKVEGCFAEVVLQEAPFQSINLEEMIPTQLEIGVGDKIVSLPAQETQPQGGSINYEYTKDERTYSSTWYTVRQVFVVDETTANILSNAPAQKLKARIRLANNNSIVFPIGVETVKRWKEAYSFNPLCSPN